MAKSDSVVDPTARDKYLLEVTTGPSYDPSTHHQIPVNSSSATHFTGPSASCWIHVRIKDYHGLPRSSPSTSPYFSHRLHTSDRYSIAFSFVPKTDISGTDLVMGFDYDHSIKHQLPPGFKYAMKIATSMLDPGLYSDPYSDEPYLYGPALSSFFAFRVGEKTTEMSAEEQLARLNSDVDGVIEEGADGSGAAVREDSGLPTKWKKRRKYFLGAQALENFIFEKDRMYHADFFNPHLDFANFSLRLPGFSISVAKYIDEKTHHLRFVLRNRKTEEVLFVVFFKLLFGEELHEKLQGEKELVEPVSMAATAGEKNSLPGLGGRDDPETLEADQCGPETTRPAIETEPTSQPDHPSSSPSNQDQESGGITTTATAAASNLANSIYAAFAAMGFANSSSFSSESDTDSRSNSPPPSSRSLEVQVDDMDDATVEQFLQARHSNA